MEFVALDFETANQARNSACEVALVKFRDGQPVDSYQSLIRQDQFAPFNTRLHGITAAMVANSPSFDEIWPSIRDFVGSRPLVAHNAAFDMSVLTKSLQREAISGSYDYFCTMVLSRRLLDITYYGLPGVAEALGVEYPMEHRALTDATAAGQVAVELMSLGGVGDIYELASVAKITPGTLSDLGASGTFFSGRRTSLSSKDRQKILESIDASELYEDPDFAGKKIVFTGTLQSMTQDEARLAVLKAGGVPIDSVSSKTDMLVFGYQDPRVLRGKPLSNKRQKAEELRLEGAEIEVVDELQFLQMLESRD